MILSEWRKAAPNRECMNNKVVGVLKPVLAGLGADGDPECWVLWGEDPESRYSVMAATIAGLITVAVRIVAGEGPRATGKLIRWSKVQVSELGLESSGGHRVVAVQVEGQVLKGMDEEADRICEFVRGLLAGVDGRLVQAPDPSILQALQHAAAVSGVRGSDAPARTAGKPGLKSVPAAVVLGLQEDDEAAAGPAKPAARKTAPKAPTAKAPAPKSQPAWVAPHPIALPPVRAIPAHVPPPTPGKPAPHKPPVPAGPHIAKPETPAAAAHKTPQPPQGEPGSVWEVPAPSESLVRDTKRPRTWTP